MSNQFLKKLKFLFSGEIYLATLCGILIIILIIFFWYASNLWKQIIAYIIGVVTVVLGQFVSHYLRSKLEDQKLERERQQIIQAIYSELCIMSENFSTYLKTELQLFSKEKPFIKRIHLEYTNFPIYAATASKLGAIPSVTLRHDIMNSYTLAQKLVNAVAYHNDLVKDYYTSNKATDEKQQALLLHQPSLQELYDKTSKSVEQTIKDLLPFVKNQQA